MGSADLDRGVTLAATSTWWFQAQLRDLIDFGGLSLSGQGVGWRRTTAGASRTTSGGLPLMGALWVVGLTSDLVEKRLRAGRAPPCSGMASESGLLAAAGERRSDPTGTTSWPKCR